jgi:alpha/beta superfamily hydrolase
MRLLCGGIAVRERIVQIAAENDPAPLLTGVLSERDLAAPSTAERTPPRAILLLSTGRERRIGPHRLWVPWARRRAALGDMVLRLDRAGVGDSASHRSGVARREPHELRETEDVARAVAWLRREHRARSCTIVGLNAAAMQALRAALADSGVQHVVTINASTWHRPPDGPAAPASFVATLVARLRRSPPDTELGTELALAGRRGARTHAVALADHRFAGAASRAELYARLDALLAPAPATVVESTRALALARP